MVRRRLRPLQDDDGERGLSLAELIVGVTVTLVLLGMVVSFFMIGSKTIASTRTTSLDSGVASNLMNEISRVIRVGSDNPIVGTAQPQPAFLAASNESLTMYSFVDASTAAVNPVIVQFSLDGTRSVVEKRWAATSTAGGYFVFPDYTSSAPSSTRRLGGPVAPTPSGAAQLFTYNAASGPLSMPGTGTIAPTDLDSIISVQVDIRVNTNTASNAPGIEMQNTVGIPNLGK